MDEIERQVRRQLSSQVPGLKQPTEVSTDAKVTTGKDSKEEKKQVGKKDSSECAPGSVKSNSDNKHGAKSEKDKKIDSVVKLFEATNNSGKSDSSSNNSEEATVRELKKKIAERQEEIARLRKQKDLTSGTSSGHNGLKETQCATNNNDKI